MQIYASMHKNAFGGRALPGPAGEHMREGIIGITLTGRQIPLVLAVLFYYLAVLDPRVGHTMDVLSPFIPVFCHSD